MADFRNYGDEPLGCTETVNFLANYELKKEYGVSLSVAF
jgi:hypothetical protein